MNDESANVEPNWRWSLTHPTSLGILPEFEEAPPHVLAAGFVMGRLKRL
jgi:hypothetical protein